ncbi:MAG: VWA domain-containing protein [Sedimentisphaerales bacterium]|nr:VWA domain-containing protein [Sedimentisphaerales bacterium]
MTKRRAKISTAAAGGSAIAHLLLLGAFAAVSLQPAETPDGTLGAVSVQQIQQVIEQPLITEKPEIKPPPPEPEPQKAPQQTKPVQPPVQTPPKSYPAPKTVSSSPRQDASFFGNKTAAQNICFVVDCSGSMYGRLGMIQRQLKSCIAALFDTQSFCVIFFMDGNSLLETGSGTLMPATGQAKSEAFTLIDSVHLGGQTNALQALQRAMQLRDRRGRAVQVVYFLTDGFDLSETPGQPFDTQIQTIRKSCAPGAVIHTIGLWVSEQDQQRLKQIAEMTGGTFLHIDN